MTQANAAAPDEKTRRWIAIGIVITGVTLLIIVSGVAIGFADSDDRPEMARLVFASAVPLLGTWVGAVLAFYFAKENLQAASDVQRTATENTVALAARLAPTTPVNHVMIPVSGIDPQRVVGDAAEANGLKLNELYRAMRDKQRSRLPVLDAATAALYVVHEADIDKYAQGVTVAADALGDDHTLQELLAVPELKKAVLAFTAVPPTASIDEARAKLQSDPDLKDIFVTVGGRPQDRALGWLTQSDLARIA